MQALPLDAAADRLRDPCAAERYGPLGAETVLWVDVSTPGGALDEAPGVLAARLRALPCPTVAWRAEAASPAGAALLPAFDVLAANEGELAPVLEAAKAHPQAAAALVQLLRHGEGLDVHGALFAESLVYSTLQAGPEFATWLAQRVPARPPRPPAEPPVLARRDGATLRVTLNRPERRNAYGVAVRDALCEALAVAEADPSLEAVILDGAGPCFSSGGDLDEFGTLPDPATAHAVRGARNAARQLAQLARRTPPVRVEARVHGACVGAGVELPAFAQRVVAQADAWFQLPEVRMGLVPGSGGTASLPRRIGRQRTAWLALSGARLGVSTAREWGLVDAVV